MKAFPWQLKRVSCPPCLPLAPSHQILITWKFSAINAQVFLLFLSLCFLWYPYYAYVIPLYLSYRFGGILFLIFSVLKKSLCFLIWEGSTDISSNSLMLFLATSSLPMSMSKMSFISVRVLLILSQSFHSLLTLPISSYMLSPSPLEALVYS